MPEPLFISEPRFIKSEPGKRTIIDYRYSYVAFSAGFAPTLLTE
jgi:hypothetical protein